MLSNNGFKRYGQYTRQQVARVLAPDYAFRAQTGTWGLHGIVAFGKGPNYVFFVTYGQSQGEHDFDEGVDENGVLRWQSQPRHDFDSLVIQNLIEHDETSHNILLFLRTASGQPYTYLGCLRYVAHDSERVRPVHFQWRIMDFTPSPADLERIGLQLEPTRDVASATARAEAIVTPPTLSLHPSPKVTKQSAGVALSTQDFQRQAVDYEEQDRNNRQLGKEGEAMVLQYERERLMQCGQAELAARVEHVAVTIGDAAGYDIRSFDPRSGDEIHIEVKTTRGPATTPFFMSAAEKRHAESCAVVYCIYRLYRFNTGKQEQEFFVLGRQAIVEQLDFTPVSYRVKLRPS